MSPTLGDRAAPEPAVEDLALRLAGAVRTAVVPHLGAAGSRALVGWAPGGDATMAVDEVAEQVVERALRDAGDIAAYTEDRGLVVHGRPRAILVIDPVDGTRPAAAGLESACVSIAVAPPDESATLGDVGFGVVQELKSGRRFYAGRGRGVRIETIDGDVASPVLSANHDLAALFWTAGLRGRPSLPLAVVLEDLVDASGMQGGFFDLGSATFSLTRLVTGQLDAYVDVGRRVLDEVPQLEAEFIRVGAGSVCTNFPYDVAAAALVVEEAGGVVTHADGRALADHPAVGSGRRDGLAVLAAATRELHDALLAAVDRGMDRLRAWLARPGTMRP